MNKVRNKKTQMVSRTAEKIAHFLTGEENMIKFQCWLGLHPKNSASRYFYASKKSNSIKSRKKKHWKTESILIQSQSWLLACMRLTVWRLSDTAHIITLQRCQFILNWLKETHLVICQVVFVFSGLMGTLRGLGLDKDDNCPGPFPVKLIELAWGSGEGKLHMSSFAFRCREEVLANIFWIERFLWNITQNVNPLVVIEEVISPCM